MRFFCLFLLLMSATVASAQIVDPLASLRKVSPYAAVGRLTIKGAGFCTGTLVSSRHVLTAAHCLYDEAGNRVSNDRLEFFAGLTGGRAKAFGRAKQSAVHPKFRFARSLNMERIRHDIALVLLQRPVDTRVVRPFPMIGLSDFITEVDVVSYAADRTNIAGLQRRCNLLESNKNSMIFDCFADFGASGSPVIVNTTMGPAVLSVLSSKAQWKGQRVSIGSYARDRVWAVQGLLDEQGISVFPGQ